MEVTRFTLDNGLRVVHNHDKSTAMVAVDLLYGVGARDESPHMTGLAHLFEHLMFGGSANVPDFDAALQRAGGMSNAWTSNDFTNFYDVLPAHNVETAFWLESDRMLSPRLSSDVLEVQKSVVIEEFKQQCLNRPYGDMGHLIRQLSYTTHPYRWPVIGLDFSHIEKVTESDAREFFYSRYSPSNAVLAVSGNVDLDTVRRLAQKWFGSIPARPTAPAAYSPEPLQTSPRFAEASGNVPHIALTITYPMDGYGSPDYFGADLLTDLLANGTSSRFYRNLAMGSDMFSEIDASITGSEDPGLLMINARLNGSGDDDIRKALSLIDGELQSVLSTPFTPHEVERAVNRMESAAMFSNLNYLSKAQVMASAEYHGENPDRQIDNYRRLSPDDILLTARRIIRPDSRNLLIYRPSSQS